MPGSECVSQEGATVLHQATEGDLSIPDQLLLRLTGTAGVLLRTDLKVLTWAEETGRNSGQQDGILGFFPPSPTCLKGLVILFHLPGRLFLCLPLQPYLNPPLLSLAHTSSPLFVMGSSI